MRRVWLALMVGAVLVLGSGTAEAQFTGGSMGGSSWGGGSSYSGGSSWGGSSSWSSSSWSSSSWSSSSWGSSGGYSSSSGGAPVDCSSGDGVVFVILIVIIIVVAIGKYYVMNKQQEWPSYDPYTSYSSYTPKVDVSVLRLGIDWNERAHVQKEMERIAKTINMSSPAGLLQMLREVALVLRRSKDSWLYASCTDAKPMSQSQAEAFFTAQANDARSRYKAEMVRAGAGGVATQDAPDHIIPGFDEGEGLVVITIVMAVKGEFNDFGVMSSVEDVRAWFEALNYVNTGSLVACEVVWSPAAEDDRLSSAELVVLYPGMKKLKHGVLAGRAECEYCHGHFPAELVTCPHCGGKVSDEYKAA